MTGPPRTGSAALAEPDRDWPLDPGETVLWQGRPSAALSLRPIRHVTDQLVIVWGVLGLGVTVALAAVGVPGAGWGLVGTALFIGLQLGLGALYSARQRQRTRYAVTDRRAIFDRGGIFSSATPLDPGAVGLEPGPPDCVMIGKGPLTYRMEAGGTQTTWRPYRLDMIEDGARVAELLRAAAGRNAELRPPGWTWSVLPLSPAELDRLRQALGATPDAASGADNPDATG